MKKILLTLCFALFGGPALPMGEDNPLIAMGQFDRLEYKFGDGESGVAWDADFWIGKDIDKFRFFTEGGYTGGTADGFFRAVYSRSLLPFWDLNGGWRRQFGGGRQWDAATVEIVGTLPQNVFAESSFSIGEHGQTLLWSNFEYRVVFNSRNPRWILAPELEFDIYGKDDPTNGIGSGLSEMDLRLRLHRQFRPDLSPYIGVNWHQQFGETADFSKAAGHDASELRWIIGLQFWF